MRKLQALFPSILVALAAGGLVAAQPPAPPQQTPTFRSGVTLVPIDVRVVDRDGKPVTDLKAEDFRIFEDNALQPLAHFSRVLLVSGPPGPAMRARAGVPPFDGAAQGHRIFLIVLGADALGSRPLGPGTAMVPDASNALAGLVHLVRDRLLPQDQVALVARDRATDFSTDHERLAAMLERIREPEFVDLIGPPEDPAPVSDTELGFAEYVNAWPRQSNDIENLYYGIKYLRFMPGEKHLIYVTAMGIRRPLPGTLESARTEPWQDLEQVGFAATDARVALHVIQTGGVPGTPLPFLSPLPVRTPLLAVAGQAQFGAASAGTAGGSGGTRALQPEPGFDRPAADVPVPIPGMDASGLYALGDLRAVAEATGGRASIMADARDAVERIDDETRVAYLLAYRPLNPSVDGQYRSVRVEVNRPGVTLRFRRGYHAAPAAGSLSRRGVVADARLIAGASSTRALRDIRVSAVPRFVKDAIGKKGEVVLQVTIDPARLSWTTDDLARRVAHLDVAVFCVAARNKTVGQTRGTVDLALSGTRFQQVTSNGLPYSVRVAVESRPQFVKIVVYDYAADRAGSAVVMVK